MLLYIIIGAIIIILIRWFIPTQRTLTMLDGNIKARRPITAELAAKDVME